KEMSPHRLSSRPRRTIAASGDLTVFHEALELISQLRYDEAAPKLLTLSIQLEAAGDRDLIAEVTFWLAYCYEKQGRSAEAGDLYARIVRAYSSSSAAHQAADRLMCLAPGGTRLTGPERLPEE
ncbi:MAG: hypothetical protein KAU28_09950, partial [Phycisphaerae bacterium]|nr:hypothetical protein [Phycisphaerae bacterium]